MAELTHSEKLPGVVKDLVHFMQRSTCEESQSEPRPKRQAAVDANAAFGVNTAGPVAKCHAPPSPECRKRPFLTPPVAALKEAAVGVIGELQDLLDQRRELAARNAELRIQSVDLKACNGSLQQDAKSLQSMRAADIFKQVKKESVFDITNRAAFDNSEAGRQQLSRAWKAVNAVLLQHCSPRRGSTKMLNEAGDLTASPIKRQMILGRLLDGLLPDYDEQDGEAGFADVIAHLPKRMQLYWNTMRYVIGCLKKAFDVLKYCHG